MGDEPAASGRARPHGPGRRHERDQRRRRPRRRGAQAETPEFVQQVVVDDGGRRATEQTLATRVGAWPELGPRPCSVSGAVVLVAGARRRGQNRSMSDDGVLVIIPTYNERDSLPTIVRRVRAAAPGRRTCWSSTTTARTERATSPQSLAAEDDHVARAAPHRQERAGRGLPGRLPMGDEPRVRRPRGDGCRRVAPAGAPAGHAGRPAGRRRRHRLALGARGRSRELATSPAVALPGRQPLHPGACSGCGVRDATAGFRAYRRSALERIDLRTVVLTGLLLPGRPHPTGRRPLACGSSRCRSPSSSASRATAR